MRKMYNAMLLKSDLNNWKISQGETIDKLYNNYVSTRILERSKNDFIQYKNVIFPNNSYLHLTECDDAS